MYISEQYIEEGYLFSDKTISIDLDKFESGESNKLILIAMSGGGKTTLANYLSKKYNCIHQEADSCFGQVLTKEEKKEMLFGSISKEKVNSNIVKMYNGCMKQLLLSKERAIIDGLYQQVYAILPESRKLIDSFPCIIIGTSALKSTYQRMIRANKKEKRTLNTNIKLLKLGINLNFNEIKQCISIFKKNRIKQNSNVQIFKIPEL